MFPGFDQKSLWIGIAIGVLAVAVLTVLARLFFVPAYFHGFDGGFGHPMMWDRGSENTLRSFDRR